MIYTLKIAIDDFRHLSAILNVVFIDFADAFGSIKHDFIFETLMDFGIPQMFCCLTEDLSKFSSFRIICDFRLSKEFYIVRGAKTGDPLTAVLFILVIDRVCKPMVAAALVSLNIENERNINPVPLQAFANDIAVVQSKAEVIQKMFDAGESLMNRAGLEMKPSKCAVLYARRFGNN